MKKFLALAASVAVAVLGLAAPANADTATLPYGGTATLTVPDVTLNPGGSCVHHYGTFSTTTPYDWDVDLNATGPSSWPASDYLYGDGAQTQIVDLTLCPSLDGPGTYTLSGLMEMHDSNYNLRGQVFVSDQFTISHPAPPPPPPVVQPPVVQPPPVVYDDVTGRASKRAIYKGVRITLRSYDTHPAKVEGKALVWKVKYDNRTRTIRQGAGERRTLTLRFSSGRHVVKVFHNGTRVLTSAVRVR